MILRGTPVDIDKDDRSPRLSEGQAHDLLTAALNEYRVALWNYPARVVIHKSSHFSDEEIGGLESAAQEVNIDTVDFVTVMDSKLRLFRDGNYPPYRMHHATYYNLTGYMVEAAGIEPASVSSLPLALHA